MGSISVNYIFSCESENITCIFNSPSDCGSLWIMLRSSTAPESDWLLAFVWTADPESERQSWPTSAVLSCTCVSMPGLCRLHVKVSLNKVVNASCSWSGLQTDISVNQWKSNVKAKCSEWSEMLRWAIQTRTHLLTDCDIFEGLMVQKKNLSGWNSNRGAFYCNSLEGIRVSHSLV